MGEKQRIVIERAPLYRIECDGERHWFIFNPENEPERDLGPCLEPTRHQAAVGRT